MNINDLISNTGHFCDAIEALTGTIWKVEYEAFEKSPQKQEIQALYTLLVEHQSDLANYLLLYHILPDPFLLLQNELIDFFKKAVLLGKETRSFDQFTEIQNYIDNAWVLIDEENYFTVFKAWGEKILWNRLAKYKRELQTNSLAQLIGEKMIPSISYLGPSPLNNPNYQNTQTYYRSERHHLAKQLKGKNHILYQDSRLTWGDRAHVGSYGNTLQMLGDINGTSSNKISTSTGTAHLYNAILHYKNALCKYVVTEIIRIRPNGLQTLKIGAYNDYPCLMVYINANTTVLPQGVKKASDAAFECWVDFLISYLVASINHEAFGQNLPIEMQRRSSFGFLTPTIAPTGKSMRINLGITPKWYANLLIQCLIGLDDLLFEKILHRKELPPIPKDIFYNSATHLSYLGGKYPPKTLSNLLELLWAPVDTSGKTTLQNIDRTAYAVDGVSAIIFNALNHNNNHHQAFNQGLTWAIQQLTFKKSGLKHILTFNQNDNIAFINNPVWSDETLDSDVSFWNVIKQLVAALKKANDPILQEAVEGIEFCEREKNINYLCYSLEQCGELTFIAAIKKASQTDIGDGYGSDSEDESDDPRHTLYTKKVTVHNGMRAILAAVIAAASYLKQLGISCDLCMDSAYYETPLGMKLIPMLHGLDTVRTATPALANTILYDLNACITDGKKNATCTIDNKIVLILDTTSASTEMVKKQVQYFAASQASMLLLVESGFKNQQLSYQNPYGTVRIFTKNKMLREQIYEQIKTSEPPILSGTSHAHRRQMKELGMVPVTSLFFDSKKIANNAVNLLANNLEHTLKL